MLYQVITDGIISESYSMPVHSDEHHLVTAGNREAIHTVTVSTTLDSSYYMVLVNSPGSARTITLPPVADNKNRIYHIKKIDSSAYTITIDGNASETIDGDTSILLSGQWSSVKLHCDGTAWFIKSRYVVNALQKIYLIDDFVLTDHTGGLSTNSAAYIKQRSITLDSLYPDPSTIRISFIIGSNDGATTVYGRIYKNGGAVGTERSTTSMFGETFTEDISFAEGDIIQLYVHSDGSADLTTTSFKVHGTANTLTLVDAIENSEIGVSVPFAITQTTP